MTLPIAQTESAPASQGTWRVVVSSPDRLAELRLLDAHSTVRAQGAGTVEAVIGHGLYLIEARAAVARHAQYLYVPDAGDPLQPLPLLVGTTPDAVAPASADALRVISEGHLTIRLPPLRFAAAAPLDETLYADPIHRSFARDCSRAPGERIGQGSSLFVCVRRPDSQGGNRLSATFKLRDLEGEERFDFSRNWQCENGILGCAIALDPGLYHLVLYEKDVPSVERTVLAQAGCQSQLFFLASSASGEDHSSLRATDVLGSSFHMRRDEAFDASAIDLRTAELLQVALASRRPFVAEAQFAECLVAGEKDPLIWLLASYLARLSPAVVAPERTQALFALVKETFGPLPDVDALALEAGEDVEGPFTNPPLLVESWFGIVRAAQRQPRRVPGNSLAGRCGGAMLADGPWLVWNPQPRESVIPDAVAFETGVARLVENRGQSERGSFEVFALRADLSPPEQQALSVIARFRARAGDPEHGPTGGLTLQQFTALMGVPPSTAGALISGIVYKVERKYRYQVAIIEAEPRRWTEKLEASLKRSFRKLGISSDDHLKILKAEDWSPRLGVREPLAVVHFTDGNVHDPHLPILRRLAEELVHVNEVRTDDFIDAFASEEHQSWDPFWLPDLDATLSSPVARRSPLAFPSAEPLLMSIALNATLADLHLQRSDRTVAVWAPQGLMELVSAMLRGRSFNVVAEPAVSGGRPSLRALCGHPFVETDVLVLIDGPGAELPRAWLERELAVLRHLGIGVLYLAWPGKQGIPETALVELLQLEKQDIEGGAIGSEALARIARRLESLRAAIITIRRRRVVESFCRRAQRHRVAVRFTGARTMAVSRASGVRTVVPLMDMKVRTASERAEEITLLFDPAWITPAAAAHLARLNFDADCELLSLAAADTWLLG